ncbi:hypothetical protein EXIGLDRAFT_415309 [Exidia glandulosa HHB12029]|uniref:Uncharacterized protein n=1 Tax=Exidia glandulosa HHB12029 TaxID=1314781 RepID=A0A165PRB3_EXIGL|nr:hypothetical protein EXIGLDRAFT_415309 [Exidia glandulosa HHB12029]
MLSTTQLLSHKPSQQFKDPNQVGKHSAPFRTTYARFSADPGRLMEWRDHLELDELSTSTSAPPDVRYARILPYLVKAKDELVRAHGWKDAQHRVDLDTMAFAIEKTVRGASYALAFPRALSTFWECEQAFTAMFHSGLFAAAPSRSKGIVLADIEPPLASMFYFLQTVVPGMCLIVMDETSRHGVRRIARALPPEDWLIANDHALCSALGGDYYLALVSRAINCSIRTQSVDDDEL